VTAVRIGQIRRPTIMNNRAAVTRNDADHLNRFSAAFAMAKLEGDVAR
jgi:hypothetical protein